VSHVPFEEGQDVIVPRVHDVPAAGPAEHTDPFERSPQHGRVAEVDVAGAGHRGLLEGSPETAFRESFPPSLVSLYSIR